MALALSQTGVFKDINAMTVNDGLYSPTMSSSRSDGWRGEIAMGFRAGRQNCVCANGRMGLPERHSFCKEFRTGDNEQRSGSSRSRLETRLLVCDAAGGVYGVTYKWRADNSDADLLDTNLEEAISIKTAAGIRTQTWYYPSRQDCLTCHTTNAGLVLGVKTRQLNRDFTFPSGVTDNELRAWNHAGLFEPGFDETSLPTFARLARADDKTRSVEDRARSFLDANCGHCHRPGGTVALFDARYDMPLANQNLINGRVLIDERIDSPRSLISR